MPKEGAGLARANSGGEGQHPPPLKRGDACLYCRRRRIRCSATKPSCSNCAGRRECVYDTGKPVSRVRMLEERVAELEGYLAAGLGTPASGGAMPQRVGTPSRTQSSPYPASYQSISRPSSSGPGRLDTAVSYPSEAASAPPADFDWDLLDPGFVTLVNQLGHSGSVSTPTPTHPAPRHSVTPTPNVPHVPSLPTDHYPAPPLPAHVQEERAQAMHQHVSDIPPNVGGVVQRVPIPVPSFPPLGQIPLGTHRQPTYDPNVQATPTVPNVPIGGWWDPNDIPPNARDQLLGMFFTSVQAPTPQFHVPRFMASLTLAASKRPHPCLLYAMYLSAAHRATSPSLRALESHFLQIATTRLNESITRLDRLFDATRAANILSVYRFQKQQYQAGIMMNAQAVQLAISCGLHQIPSCVWRRPQAFENDEAGERGRPMMRSRRWVIPPPADTIELGERIQSFWTLYWIDRTQAMASQWPPALKDEDIKTPLPRPLYEFEMGIVSRQDDYTLSSIYDATRPPQNLPWNNSTSLHILLTRVLGLVEKASKLMYLHDEPGVVLPEPTSVGFSTPFPNPLAAGFDIDLYLAEANEQLLQSLPAATSPAFAGTRTARIRTPKAYAHVRTGLLAIDAALPPQQRTPWDQPHDGTGWWNNQAWAPQIAALHFMTGIAWMFLYDVYAPYAENTMAVNVARRLVLAIRSKPVNRYTESDSILNVCWSFIILILVREVHRLNSTGDAKAADVQVDLDVVVAQLRRHGRPDTRTDNESSHEEGADVDGHVASPIPQADGVLSADNADADALEFADGLELDDLFASVDDFEFLVPLDM